MKIALNCRHTCPSDGGAHTFKNQLLSEFRKVAPSQQHSFILVGNSKTKPESSSGLAGVESTHEAFISRQVTHRAYSLGKRVQRVIGKNPFENVQLADRLLVKNKVEFVINLGNYVLGNLDIPYATVVWDLEHRRLPFFPELSHSGEWEAREKFYSHVLGRAALIITGTECGKEQIQRYYGIDDSRIVIIPHPTQHSYPVQV